jgi:8-amino-7-oxononanoate synthase
MSWPLLEEELRALDEQGLLREPDAASRARAEATAAATLLGLELVDASSNDYLGLAREFVSRETLEACAASPPGAGSSRLIHGTRLAHEALESELADWVGLPSALLFASGYAANVGLVSALSQPGTVVFSDALNHASIIDGCRLGRGRTIVVPHRDLVALERALAAERPAQARWVVTETYFSMDGDGPDLRELRRLCDRHAAALIVDEAHALGVFGPRGAGRCAEAGVSPDALIGTLGKAVGLQGAFVAGPMALRTWLWNRARSFVFSTATSPLLCELARVRLREVQAADAARTRLAEAARELRSALRRSSAAVPPDSFGPIIPIVVGENSRALSLARAFAARGLLVQAIRPPTVPPGSARLRVTITAAQDPHALARLTAAIQAELGAGEAER